MALSEARKAANKRWDKEHLAIVACQVRKEYKEAFAATAYANGTTPGTLIRGWIDEYMETHKSE